MTHPTILAWWIPYCSCSPRANSRQLLATEVLLEFFLPSSRQELCWKGLILLWDRCCLLLSLCLSFSVYAWLLQAEIQIGAVHINSLSKYCPLVSCVGTKKYLCSFLPCMANLNPRECGVWSSPSDCALPAPPCVREPLGSRPVPTACTLQEYSQ